MKTSKRRFWNWFWFCSKTSRRRDNRMVPKSAWTTNVSDVHVQVDLGTPRSSRLPEDVEENQKHIQNRRLLFFNSYFTCFSVWIETKNFSWRWMLKTVLFHWFSQRSKLICTTTMFTFVVLWLFAGNFFGFPWSSNLRLLGPILYQVSQQVLDRNLGKKSLMLWKAKKLVKVCLHSS